MKKRILLCNDSSTLGTGFGNYGRQVLTRLASCGKYELAELAAYGNPMDGRQAYMNWAYYGNLPATPEEETVYRREFNNQFGEFRFDDVCIDFKPHIVWDIRDCHMISFEERSPARPYFHHVIMPTVDGIPQHDSWMATFMKADGVLAWCQWGLEVLKKTSNGRMKLWGCAPPGLDSDFVAVKDKRAHKRSIGLPEDIIIVGTVMRNQSRKLFPDLIESFALLLNSVDREMASKLFLYLHTGYPDLAGWNIPRLIKEEGISNRVLFTYNCTKCGKVYPSLFQDVKAVCKFCNNLSAITPRTQFSPSPKTLCEIYNLMDVYVQYSKREGFGLPLMEAAGCGVPIFGVDYSATSDILKVLGGTAIAVQRYARDLESGVYEALPDNNDLVKKIKDFLNYPESIKRKMSFDLHKRCVAAFSWDNTAKQWEDYFDNVEVEDRWDVPIKRHVPHYEVPQGLSDADFVRWCITHVAGRRDLQDSYLVTDLTQQLTYGYSKDMPLTRDKALYHFVRMAQTLNDFEEKRNAGNGKLSG